MLNNTTTRRAFLAAIGGAISAAGQTPAKPNIIVILADDLGFGDLGCFGSALPTPNLDKMAKEGMKLERYYSASPVCSPSRAALLTGRYPARSGVTGVLFPNTTGGLSASEQTLPKILRANGYRTGCVGKWHLGNTPTFRASSAGFDEFQGVPYSNDMQPLPFLSGTEVMDSAPRLGNLTERFTIQAVKFIDKHKDKPFFLYFAHTAPHIPLVPSERFKGKSGKGSYGDVVAELDWSVGEVFDALKRNGIDDNTLVIFTSDNGPWYQGSAGRLQGRKGSTYEGGVRVPCLARFPGRIPAASAATAIASTMDLLPTIAALAGSPVAKGFGDGLDIWPVLSGAVTSMERDALLFFDGWHIQALRWGPWKLHVARYNSHPWTDDPPGGRYNLPLHPPELYHIDDDPTEGSDRSIDEPELVLALLERLDRQLLTMPEQVRLAWLDTRSQRVMGTPTGALPRRELDR